MGTQMTKAMINPLLVVKARERAVSISGLRRSERELAQAYASPGPGG